MIRIDGYNLKVSKGDTFSLLVRFAGTALPDGAMVLFTVRTLPGDGKAIIEKTYSPDENNAVTLKLEGTETNLAPKRYWWDLRVTLPGNEVVTPFMPAAFEIVGVVGDAHKQ